MSGTCCVASASPEATRELGARLGGLLRAGDVVALSGELGAGKTCLVQGIARGLGVPPEVPVTSPTFTLVGEYPARIPLRHADFYRVEHASRLEDAGFDDLLDGRGVLVVEWAERFPEALPAEHLAIRIELEAAPGAGQPARLISFSGGGLRAEQIRKSLSESC